MTKIDSLRYPKPRKVLRLTRELKTARQFLKGLPKRERWCRQAMRETINGLMYELSWELAECGRPAEGLALALKLPKRTCGYERALAVGHALSDMKRLDEAQAVLEQAARRYPDDPSILNLLSCVAAEKGDDDSAIGLLDRALKSLPRSSLLLGNKAGALYRMGLYEDAMVISERLLKRCPNDIMHIKGVGYCHLMMGYPERAMPYFQRAVRHKDAEADAWNGLFWSYYDQGMDSNADQAAHEALRRFPEGDATVYVNLGISYLEKGWTEEARGVLQKGLNKFPDDEDLKVLLKDIDDDEKDPDKGTEVPKKPLLLVVKSSQRIPMP